MAGLTADGDLGGPEGRPKEVLNDMLRRKKLVLEDDVRYMKVKVKAARHLAGLKEVAESNARARAFVFLRFACNYTFLLVSIKSVQTSYSDPTVLCFVPQPATWRCPISSSGNLSETWEI